MKRIVALIIVLLPLCCCAKVHDYTVNVIEKYPHDTGAYTQGLFFWNGELYETTGQFGESSLRKVNLKTGEAIVKKSFGQKYFAEGSCIVDGRLYILTWTNRLAFEYDAASLKYVKSYTYPREGWGLASIPANFVKDAVMVASDGTSKLFFLDKDLRCLKSLEVTLNGKSIRYLNELEWIDGKIWANIYTTDVIVIINPSTGAVEGRIDCSSLIPQKARDKKMDVLNGIAKDAAGNIYLTGKYWPWMFRVKLREL